MGILWSALWFYFVTETPQTNPYISQVSIFSFSQFDNISQLKYFNLQAELKYIESEASRIQEKDERFVTPWKGILTSLPFWVVTVTQVGNFWGYYTLLTGTPLYLNGIQHFSLEQVSSHPQDQSKIVFFFKYFNFPT